MFDEFRLFILEFTNFSEDVFWYPSGTLRTNRILNIVFGYAMHYIPSYLLDMFAYMCGKKPM